MAGRGGRRPGAGRKPRPENIGLLPHVARADYPRGTPALVTMTTADDVPELRSPEVLPIVLEEIQLASDRGFEIVDHAVFDREIRILAKAKDGIAFARGMQRLASRIARRVNMLANRRGSIWRERYRRDDLATTRALRTATRALRDWN